MPKVLLIYQYRINRCYWPMKHVEPCSMQNLSKQLFFQWLEAKKSIIKHFLGHVMSHLSREKCHVMSKNEFVWIFKIFEIQKIGIRGFSPKWPHFVLNDFIFPVKFTFNDKELNKRSPFGEERNQWRHIPRSRTPLKTKDPIRYFPMTSPFHRWRHSYRWWMSDGFDNIAQVIVIPVSIATHYNTLKYQVYDFWPVHGTIRGRPSGGPLPFFLGPVNRQAAIEWSISTFGFFGLSPLAFLSASGAEAWAPGDGADFCFQALKSRSQY